MPITIKAHAFWVTPVNGNGDDLKTIAQNFGQNGEDTEFSHRGHDFLCTESAWHTRRSALTATVFRLRDSNLPAAVSEDGDVEELPIDDSTNLGEPTCFAYFPDLQVAFIHYSHTGARHTVLPAFLNEIGFAQAIKVEPVIRLDMLERLENTDFFTTLEFALKSPQSIRETRAAEGSVADTLNIMDVLNAENAHIRITIGYNRSGGGLSTRTVKDLALGLAHFGDREVSTLKVRGSENADEQVQTLDLLRARIVSELEVSDRNREMDRQDCQNKLLRIFEQNIQSLIEEQLANNAR